MSDPFVVVGGDAAGLSAASKCKREDPDREVLVFERGRWVSYAHCGEPYFVKGEVEHLSDLISLSPDDVAERGIDLRRESEVTAVDTDAEMVTVEGLDGTETRPYGDLLVATGASASMPLPGSDLHGVLPMHGLDDAAAMRAFLAPPTDALPDAVDHDAVDAERVRRYAARDPPETVAVVGGGYVGVEMAEALAAGHDVRVQVFHRGERLLSPFGGAVGERVTEHVGERVDLHLESEVAGLDGEDGRVTAVECEGGERHAVDAAVVGVGVTPNSDLLSDTPVETGPSGAALTDRYGETAVDGVYAAGDCAADRHVVSGEQAWVPLGLTANRAGRAVGATVAGDPTPVGGVAGTAAVKAFELEAARTGLLPEEAREAGFDPVAETVTAGSRSGYYPGAAETTVTLVADRGTGRLLGGSIVGADRAAVRIDTVATALEADLTVGEVERLDLQYAPPFSPVWDPVLVAAKVLRGSLDG